MKKYVSIVSVMFVLITCLSSFAVLLHSSQPPQGYSGATPGENCTHCHASYGLNSGGGSVTTTGLPIDGYTAGTAYNFSITNSHSAADRKRWGFAITALNSANQPVGTFSTTNPNVAVQGNELAHFGAVITDLQQSYTYDNLTWTAPANPGPADQTITFYFAGNAANGTGSTSGDYIYASTKTISLAIQTYTFTGNGNWGDAANWSNNTVPPATITGTATIVIDPPLNGECVLNGVQHISSAANLIVKEGKKLRIAGGLIINQ